jgi:inosine-uridine nucleoside N-ribohydrolase
MNSKILSYASLIFLSQMVPLSSQEFPKLSEAFRLAQLTPPAGKVRMVLDTDTFNEVDDQFALTYALLSRERIEVEAVYAAPFHNSRSAGPEDGMQKSYEEILKILKMMNISADEFAFRGSRDYLRDVSQPHRSAAALDLIKRAQKSTADDPLYVVPVGCITNIASALLIEPDIIDKIVVVWLGGNAFYWPTQREFNLRQDVLAARVVFDSGVPFVTMPCRPVVSHLHTTIPELTHHLKGKNQISDYLLNIVVEYGKGRKAYSKVIWDVSAVAWLVQPEWVASDIVHSPILTDQLTVSVDQSRHFIRVAKSLNRDAIFGDLFDKLAGSN